MIYACSFMVPQAYGVLMRFFTMFSSLFQWEFRMAKWGEDLQPMRAHRGLGCDCYENLMVFWDPGRHIWADRFPLPTQSCHQASCKCLSCFLVYGPLGALVTNGAFHHACLILPMGMSDYLSQRWEMFGWDKYWSGSGHLNSGMVSV